MFLLIGFDLIFGVRIWFFVVVVIGGLGLIFFVVGVVSFFEGFFFVVWGLVVFRGFFMIIGGGVCFIGVGGGLVVKWVLCFVDNYLVNLIRFIIDGSVIFNFDLLCDVL